MKPPLVICTEHLETEPFDWLAERCAFVRCAPEAAEFGPMLHDARGLVVRTYTRVDRELLAAAPRLKVVGRAGVGLDNIDVVGCRAHGVEVVHTPEANTQAVVEYTMGLIHDALRSSARITEAISSDAWKQLRTDVVMGRQLCDMTVGIYGLGRIGRRVARAAGALGARVIYCDLLEIPDAERFGAEPVDREALLRESDVLTIHVDARPENNKLIGTDALALVRPDVLLINTSRGFVVDAAALAAFIEANPHAEARLDVHHPEPFGADYPLLGLDRVHLYPHLAAKTTRAMLNMSWVVKDVWAVLQGERPAYPAPATHVQ
jgi:phosphoglycerate dehydrogenase-like enzyme